METLAVAFSFDGEGLGIAGTGRQKKDEPDLRWVEMVRAWGAAVLRPYTELASTIQRDKTRWPGGALRGSG